MAMSEALKEIMGFFCRWCLLGLAVSAVAVVGFAMILGAKAASRDNTCHVELSDAIWQSQRTAYASGYVEPELELGDVRHFISCPGGRNLQGGYGYRNTLRMTAGTRQEGLHELEVKGSPYGRFAFFEPVQASCLIVSPQEEIYAVDARLIHPRNQAPSVSDRLLPLLEAKGVVVFFHPWHLRDYPESRELRQEIYRRYPRSIYLFHPTNKKEVDGLLVLRSMLSTLNRPPELGPQVITEDEEVAKEAQRRRLRFHSPEQLLASGVATAPSQGTDATNE
jgi:hypothetical protein